MLLVDGVNSEFTRPLKVIVSELLLPRVELSLTTKVVAVTVVPVIAAGVVPPMAGGADRSSVPPRVKLPEVVTVPDKDKPFTVPVPLTEVTVPVPPAAMYSTSVAPGLTANTLPALPA